MSESIAESVSAMGTQGQADDFGRQLEELRGRLAQVEAKTGKGQVDRLSLVVFSGTLDHQIAAFTLATAAAASGMEVNMFFTFWGFSALRDKHKRGRVKNFLGRMFGWMLPRGSRQLPVSQWQMGGMGAALIRKIMSDNKFASLEDLMQVAAELEVNIFACDMSMNVMGFSMEELIDYPKLTRCGAATFVERASAGKVTMFI
jgi:peroxiredoxin family protein